MGLVVLPLDVFNPFFNFLFFFIFAAFDRTRLKTTIE